jgi:ATP-dependent RNA helicase RhlE
MPFAKLRLIEPLLRAVRSEGYTIPTEIQTQAIPHVLEGRDLQGCAQTGTGKTAAFALPILQLLAGRPAPKPKNRNGGPDRPIRAMVLTPTRELAAQIGDSFRVYGQHTGLRQTVVFGGVSQVPQSRALHQGVDILVATPGRLLDLLQQKLLSLGEVEILVLDETDRMLDMGFIRDVQRIMAYLPERRQTLLFSATMPSEIQGLANKILNDPVDVRALSESMEAETVEQVVYFVDSASKVALLRQLFKSENISRALVFTRTKHRADRVARQLDRAGIRADAMHSNKSQNARMRTLANFKSGKTQCLVASDIAARGLDVDDISHVINFDLPDDPKTYVHRIGRTGRAGAEGKAISFCSPDQRPELADVERLLEKRIRLLPHAIQPHGHARSVDAPSKPRSPEREKAQFWAQKKKDGRNSPRGASGGPRSQRRPRGRR